MQGVGMRGGMSVRGAMRGRGRGMIVHKDRMNVRMNLPELIKRYPCHRCGEFGHFIKECPYMVNVANMENDLPNTGMSQENFAQYDQSENESQHDSPNQTVPQLQIAPQSQRRQINNAPRVQRNQAQALQNMF